MRNYFLYSLLATAIMIPASAFAAQPASPVNVTAVQNDEGVLISWDAVTTDVEEEDIDPDGVVYDVYRCIGEDLKTLMASDIVETSYLDALEGIADNTIIYWQITAKTDQGSSSSYGGLSAEILIGDGDTLPYAETFNTKEGWSYEPDNFWSEEVKEGWRGFRIDDEVFFEYDGAPDGWFYIYAPGVTSEEEADGNGYLYFEPSSWSVSDSQYTSGPINLGNAENPTLTFDYFAVPEAHNGFEAMVVDENNVVNVVLNTIPVADTPRWVKANIPLKGVATGKIRLRFHAKYDPDKVPEEGIAAPICFDNIEIKDGNPVSVNGIGMNGITETLYYTLDGVRVSRPAKGSLNIRVVRNADGTVRADKVFVAE